MEYINFIIFPVIGAVIGALTNELAIKMLFRPYAPVKVGGMTLPFTPGVIPSQREVIAQNIAETFESNLLNGGEIHQILTGDKVKEALDSRIDSFLTENLGQMAPMFAVYKPKIVEKILEGIEEMANEAIAHGGELNIGQRIEAKINAMDIEHLEQLVLGFSKKQFKHITLFGGILGALIGIVQATVSIFI